MCFVQFFEDLATDGKVEAEEPAVKETQGKQVLLWPLSPDYWETEPLNPSFTSVETL